MEQAHLVNKLNSHIYCVLILLSTFLSFRVTGQIVPPKFLSGTEEAKDYMELRKIINSVDNNFIRKLPECYEGIGTFSFIVDSAGIVDIVNFSGNLPEKIVTKIRQNILSTSKRWIPQSDNGKFVNSKPFILIYYVNLSCDNMPTYQTNEYLMSFLLENAINSRENQKFNVLNNAYLLPIEGINMMRHMKYIPPKD